MPVDGASDTSWKPVPPAIESGKIGIQVEFRPCGPSIGDRLIISISRARRFEATRCMRSEVSAMLAVLATALIATGTAWWLPGAEEPRFISLFDGKSLSGWSPEHTDRYSVRDGVIVNDGGTGWLRSSRSYKDFEFQAEYRVLKKGSDTGIMFRASAESTPQEPHWPAKGYQLQVIDAEGNFMLFGHGLAPPRFERRTEALKSAAKEVKEWQKIRLKVIGPHAEAGLNGVVITTSDAIQVPEGYIGLQGENGRFEWRNLKIRELHR
jgi:hypothetical protein